MAGLVKLFMKNYKKFESVFFTYFEVFIIIILYCILISIIGIGCPIRFMTGISCAGCGMSRAWISVLKLDFHSAFYYHPLWFIPLIFSMLYLKNSFAPLRSYRFIVSAFILMFIVAYFFRLFDPSNEIVTVNIKTGVIYKIYYFITNFIHM